MKREILPLPILIINTSKRILTVNKFIKFGVSISVLQEISFNVVRCKLNLKWFFLNRQVNVRWNKFTNKL